MLQAIDLRPRLIRDNSVKGRVKHHQGSAWFCAEIARDGACWCLTTSSRKSKSGRHLRNSAQAPSSYKLRSSCSTVPHTRNSSGVYSSRGMGSPLLCPNCIVQQGHIFVERDSIALECTVRGKVIREGQGRYTLCLLAMFAIAILLSLYA